MDFGNDGTWFYYNEENEDDGGVCLKTLSLKDMQEVRKATVKERAEYKRVGGKKMPAQRFVVEEVDEELNQEMTWDRMIVDWKNTLFKGVELECTKENKVKMMSESSEFALFIAECIERLTEDEPTVEVIEKN